jgi:hypothetical protein
MLAYRTNIPRLEEYRSHPRPPLIKTPLPVVAKKKRRPSPSRPAAPKPPGVSTTIVDCISNENGATIEEMVAVLVRTFPERGADSMRNTVKIQANKHCTSKEVDPNRGRVYYRRAA